MTKAQTKIVFVYIISSFISSFFCFNHYWYVAFVKFRNKIREIQNKDSKLDWSKIEKKRREEGDHESKFYDRRRWGGYFLAGFVLTCFFNKDYADYCFCFFKATTTIWRVFFLCLKNPLPNNYANNKNDECSIDVGCA